jgi:hypothetical protein
LDRWDFEIGDHYGTIDIKWKMNRTCGKSKCDGVTVMARTTWPGDFYNWKINDGKKNINWKTRYTTEPTEWLTDEGRMVFPDLYLL